MAFPDRDNLLRMVRIAATGLLIVIGGTFGLYLVRSILTPLAGPQFGILVGQFVAIGGGALAYRRIAAVELPHWPNMNLAFYTWKNALLVVATTVVLAVGANLVFELSAKLFPALNKQAEQYSKVVQRLFVDAEGLNQVFGIAALVLAAPFCEEFLLRGTILPEQLRSQTTKEAIVLNGILFAAFHLNPVNFLPLAILGAFFAHLTCVTASLIPAISAHAVLNFFNGVLMLQLFAPDTEEMPGTGFSTMTLAIQVVVIGAASVYLWRRTITELAREANRFSASHRQESDL